MAKKKKMEAAENAAETVAEVAPVEKTEAAKVAESKPAEATVYVGRSILGLPQYTVFSGGVLPDHVKHLAEQYEGLTRLIVPVSKLQSARADVQKKGTALHLFYNNMKKKTNT